MGFRFSGLGRTFSSGQIYCHATAPQAAKPNAALIPNKTGDGMIDPFWCNSRYHFVNVLSSSNLLGSFLNVWPAAVAPKSAERGEATWPRSLVGRAISQ